MIWENSHQVCCRGSRAGGPSVRLSSAHNQNNIVTCGLFFVLTSDDLCTKRGTRRVMPLAQTTMLPSVPPEIFDLITDNLPSNSGLLRT